MAPENNDSIAPLPEGGSRSRLVPILAVAFLMVVEGVGVFILAKAVSPGPAPAVAVEEAVNEAAAQPVQDEFAEIQLAECRPSNKMSGKLIVFKIRVSALVRSTDLSRTEKLAQDRKARIEDGVNTVIRSAELNDLNEPGTETIRRRLKHELGRILGDDQLIIEVLIPELLQSGSGV